MPETLQRKRIVIAAMLVLTFSAMTVSAQENKQAGVSAAVYGEVQLSRADAAVGLQVKSGQPIFLGDKIVAQPDSGMQIMLLDQTVFTVGPRTELTVDRFVYDPATNEGNVSVSVAKGVFRFATGLVAQEKPENMTVNLPFGTIGIRGTIVAGNVQADRADVVLLGPGDNANTSDRIGRITVTGAGANAPTVEISRSGYGTTLRPDTPPSPPAPVATGQVGTLLGALERGGDEEDDGEETSSAEPAGEAETEGRQQEGADDNAESNPGDRGTARTSGQDSGGQQVTGSIGGSDSTALSGDNVADALTTLDTLDSTTDSQTDANATVTEDVATSQSLGGLTTVADLSSVTSGIGKITGSGVLGSSEGDFSFKGTVDFGQQTLAFELAADWDTAQFANDGLGTGVDATLSAGPETYAEVFDKGDVIDDFAQGEGFDSSKPDNDVTFDNLGTGEVMRVLVRMRNGADTVAKFLDVQVKIDDNGTPKESGIVTGSRD